MTSKYQLYSAVRRATGLMNEHGLWVYGYHPRCYRLASDRVPFVTPDVMRDIIAKVSSIDPNWPDMDKLHEVLELREAYVRDKNARVREAMRRLRAERRASGNPRATCIICDGALPEGSRADRQTCSARCRKAASRHQSRSAYWE